MAACRRLAAVLLSAGLVVALAACGRTGTVARPRSAKAGASASAPALERITAQGVHDLVREAGGRVVLVNVWATWCEPCREELPALLRVRRELAGKGLEVVLVSADFDTQLAQVRAFLTSQSVDFTTYLKSESDMAFINGLDRAWSGSLPATFIYDRSGKLRDFWEGQATYDQFSAKVKGLLRS
ncbi:MAG: redoxin domain-containing protein [Acidobacteriota bacterium]